MTGAERKAILKALRNPTPKIRRNIAPLLAAIGEGAGFSVGERALKSLSGKRKRNPGLPLVEAATFAAVFKAADAIESLVRKRLQKKPQGNPRRRYKHAYHRDLMAKHLKRTARPLRRFERQQQKRFGVVKGFSKERNPRIARPGMAAVQIHGAHGTKTITGPRRIVQKIARHFKHVLGKSKVTMGRLVAKR